ncbi:MAG: hypothetical protein R3243_14465 [Arenibacter latericius]|nr:hypothetical protein [Arenibacter latericius]
MDIAKKLGVKHVFCAAKCKYPEVYKLKPNEFFNKLMDIMPQFGINTPLRQAHFIAQIAHESDNFNTTEEYASGRAYEGRKDIGNTEKGDGVKYKGHGLIQVTGRKNHAEFSLWCLSKGLNVDFVKDPEMISACIDYAILSAVWYWETRGLSRYADRDDIKTITRLINGGYNGLNDRENKLRKLKCHEV